MGGGILGPKSFGRPIPETAEGEAPHAVKLLYSATFVVNL